MLLRSTRRWLWFTAMLVLMMVALLPLTGVSALTVSSVVVTDNCPSGGLGYAPGYLKFEIMGLADEDDTGYANKDYFYPLATDGTGRRLDQTIDHAEATVGLTVIPYDVYYDPAIHRNPIRLAVYDIDNAYAWEMTLLYSVVVNSPCLPFVENEANVQESAPPWNPGDGRINPDPGVPLAVYTPPDHDGHGITVYEVDQNGNGTLALEVSYETLQDLPIKPKENMLLAHSRNGKITLYKLTTGEYQINAGPDAEGKVFVTIFSGIPPSHVYRYTFNVNDVP